MARLVRIDRPGPYKIEPKDFPPDGKSIWICGCGLSETMPYCDKSHKACANETPGALYSYDAAKAQTQLEPPPPPPPIDPPPTPAPDRI
jgi:CDGSH-type Zn-finger protein